ncbi:hypothetical protein C1E24_15835 [Pseudoalteromonas phenolica]|uniref:Uncharacterized protein n=2 Tax=Pseudoalteromonas phenolica TaxID=161398 RepID=A0A5R9PYL4_9GAMM|nr:hypothetical protein C1E24_15835 [Pseudoalteromonas phenolica]
MTVDNPLTSMQNARHDPVYSYCELWRHLIEVDVRFKNTILAKLGSFMLILRNKLYREFIKMNKTIWFSLITLVFSIIVTFATFIYGNTSYLESLSLSLSLSAPLVFIFFCVFIVFRNTMKDQNSLMKAITIRAYFFTALLHIIWNSLMFMDVLSRGSLGPAQGYSGLILWLGSLKAASFGVFVGIIFHFLPKLINKNKNLNR